MSEHVIIIGGGVIGAMSAYFLSRAGRGVTVIDRGEFGKACSHGNCGYVSPSHVLPLTIPGVIRQVGLRAFSKRSPLYIRPRLSLSLWTWMFRFARNCNERQMMHAARALAPLLDESRSLYERIISEEALDCEWEPRGMLFVYQSKHHLEDYAKTAAMLEREFGRRFTKWNADELIAREPAIRPGSAAGAWHFEQDAHLRPDRLMAELRRVLLARGVTIRDRTGFIGFTRRNRSVLSARTSAGELHGTHFLVATGAYTPQLQSDLGTAIPIQPGKGYCITMPRPATCPAYPLIFEEHRVAITPMKSCYRIGSTMEFSGYDTSLDPDRLRALVDGASHYLHQPTAEPVIEQWTGLRPMTPDSLPILDRAPGFDNVWIAAGHNMLGLSLAPATGRVMAQFMLGQPAGLDVNPYQVDRF